MTFHSIIPFASAVVAMGAIAVASDAVRSVRYRKVGGIRFLRIGRTQVSFCRCKA